MRAPLVVELVGLPGAGKTTVARRVADRLAAEGRRCCSPRLEPMPRGGGAAGRAGQAARLAAFCAANPRLPTAILRFGVAIRPLRLRRAKWLRDLLELSLTLAARCRTHEVIVLDQAMLQAIWSATIHGTLPAPPVLRPLLQASVAAHGGRVALVHLDVDPETAVARIAGRAGAGSRFDRLPRDRARALLGELRARLERIVAEAVEATGAPDLRLDGRAPPDQLCEAIVEWLEPALQGRVRA